MKQDVDTPFFRFIRVLLVALELGFWIFVSNPVSNIIYACFASILSLAPTVFFGIHPLILTTVAFVGTLWVNPAKRLRKLSARRRHLWERHHG